MPRAGLSRDRVIEAGAELADQHGFDGLTVSALARRLRVTDPTLYSHVWGIADVRAGIAILAAGEMAERLGAAIQSRAKREALIAFANAYRAYALEHPGRYAATQIRIDPDIAARSAGHTRLIETSYGIFRGYRLAEPGVTDAVRLLRSTCHGFASLEATDGFGHPRQPDAPWTCILDALDVAIRRWPGRSPS
jgi:AcrR family transcriptional regulator